MMMIMTVYSNTCLCRVLVLFASLHVARTTTGLTINSNVGEIKGMKSWVQVDGNVHTLTKYLGIPYAESTAGEHRFTKPVPKAAFSTLFNATAPPPSCDASSNSFNEDCLLLNIFVPDTKANTTLLSVMIWIHGGGFLKGTSRNIRAEALSVYGNVIVVTINYRLGIFGFLRTDNGDFPGNQGLWDQHLAIKWVHDNIRAFGGHPDQVTLFGESAGSKSVIYQCLYAGNKGLFHRVIAESGSALSQRSILSHSNGESVIRRTGCLEGPVDMYSCLRSKSTYVLHRLKGTFFPIVDGDFVIQHPYDIVYGDSKISEPARNFFASLDMIAGVNMFDGGVLLRKYASLLHQNISHLNISFKEFTDVIVPWVIDDTFGNIDNKTKCILKEMLIFEYTDWKDQENTARIISNVINMSCDFTYFKSTVQTINGHINLQGGSTYFYEFAVNSSHHSISTLSFINGPTHADEIPFVFGKPVSNLSFRRNFTPEEKVVSKAMMTLWTNFAKTGNPNTPVDVKQYFNTIWPEYNTSTQSYLKIGNKLSPESVRKRFYPRRMQFWLELVPRLLQGSYKLQLPLFQPSTSLIG